MRGVDFLDKLCIIVFSILYLEFTVGFAKIKRKRGIEMVETIEHVNLAERVYEKIKDRILEENLSPDTRLISDQLAEEMGVSRTPVKEALLRLEKEGFVVSVPRRGIYVKKFSAAEIKEIYEIREVLEVLAVRLAAPLINEKQARAMLKTCDDFQKFVKRKDVRSCLKIDFEFHKLLIRASRNSKLFEMISSFNLQLLSIFVKGPQYWSHALHYIEQHMSIIDALSNHDSDLAQKLLREHIREGERLILSSMDPNKTRKPERSVG